MIYKEKEKPKNEHDASQEALMIAIGFNEEDLEANQDNILSPNQKFYLARQRLPMSCVQVSITVILCLLVSVFLISDLTSGKMGIGFILTALLLLAVAPTLWRWYTTMNDIKMNQVIAIQGRAILDLDNRNQYFLQIGDLVFKVNKDVFLAFKNGDPYALYYAPHSRTILSVEWLRPE
jgi:hypothetical protein